LPTLTTGTAAWNVENELTQRQLELV